MNAILVAQLLLACAAVPAPLQDNTSFEEKLLGQIPDEAQYRDIAFSRDGRSVAYLVLANGKMAVCVNNTRGKEYEGIADKPQFAKDGKTVVFRASSGGQWHVVVGGNPGPAMAVVGMPVFSPDLSKYAFEGRRAGQGTANANSHAVWVGGQKGPDWASCGTPAFSADSSVVAHSARVTRGTGTVYTMVINNKAGPEVQTVSNPCFAPKGKLMAYRSCSNDRWTMVVDGKAHADAWEDLGSPVWDPEGKRVAYPAGNEGRFKHIVVDGKKGEEFDQVGDPIWSLDGKVVAYRAQKGEDALIVFGDRKLTGYTRVGEPALSPDGKAVAFPAANGLRWGIIFGDKKLPNDFEMVTAPNFSPDGKSVAYQAMWKFKFLTVVNDVRDAPYDHTGLPTWAPQSNKVAYASKRENKWYMVVAYRTQEGFDEILTPPYWKSDGTKVAFGARKDRSLIWRVVEVTD